MPRLLLTGGAGFVGSNLAIHFKNDHPDWEVIALDNLKRRGSELAIGRLRSAGVHFLHGDIRNPEDLAQVEGADWMIECSAEPSVQAGYDGDPRYLVNTNLSGTLNCLEYARKHGTAMIFLSTSRVYPIVPLRALPLAPGATRLDLPDDASGPGWSRAGIGSNFPLEGSRSLYGATKLCSELIIQEYVAMYQMGAVIDRCGVITGPWQMGKVDQGFVTLWAARHYFGGNLSYIGFGGQGLQVRDILHIDDLYRLCALQLEQIASYKGAVFNVGGGYDVSVSLKELTGLCQIQSSRTLDISRQPDTHPADIPYYITDNTHVTAQTGWSPRFSVEEILKDIFSWLQKNEDELRPILAP